MPKKPAKRGRPTDAEREERRINRQFGGAVRAAREARGLSYRRAAEELEISLSHLQGIEKGEKAAGLPIAWTIARRLGFNLDKVLRDSP